MKTMSRLAAVAAVAAMAAGAQAQESAEPAGAAAGVEAGLFSSYVWRGQVVTDKAVLQPAIAIEKWGVGLEAWNNFGFSDQGTGRKNDFSETDLTLSYTAPLESVELSAGVVQYLYPNTDGEDTREAFASCGVPLDLAGIVLTPGAEVFYDFDAVEGWYASAGLVAAAPIMEETLEVTLGYSMGWGSGKYNAYYFGPDKDALNDGNVALTFPVTPLEGLTLTPVLQYTWLWDSEIRDAADESEDLYNDGGQWIVSLQAAYTF